MLDDDVAVREGPGTPIPPVRLYIGGMNSRVSESDLKAALERVLGPVDCVEKRPGRTFAFADMVRPTDYDLAITGSVKIVIDGRRCKVAPAIPRR